MEREQQWPMLTWTVGVIAGGALALYGNGVHAITPVGWIAQVACAMVVAVTAAAYAYYLYRRRPRGLRGLVTSFILGGTVTAVVRLLVHR